MEIASGAISALFPIPLKKTVPVLPTWLFPSCCHSIVVTDSLHSMKVLGLSLVKVQNLDFDFVSDFHSLSTFELFLGVEALISNNSGSTSSSQMIVIKLVAKDLVTSILSIFFREVSG